MNLTQFRLETDADGIAVVTWDVAGKSMNLIDATMMSELEQVVDATTADAGVKGVVIASGKDNFSGGADLTMLEASGRLFAETAARAGKDKAVEQLYDATSKLSRIYRKIETCGKPWAIAINREMRVVPPAPGNRPILISGRPTRVRSSSAMTR